MQTPTRESAEEAAYAAVLEELRNGVRDEPLMAKAFAEAEGQDSRAQALYLRWRSAKLLESPKRERERAFKAPARKTWWTAAAGRPQRSWSTPRPYDLLLVLAVLIALFFLNADFHRALLHLVRGLDWR